MIGRLVHNKPRIATEERASVLQEELTQVRAALAEAEARSEEQRLALESRIQEVGLMRIQLRTRDARIAALDKEVSNLGTPARRSEQIGEVKSESAFLTQMRTALAESEARSEERRLALESRIQEVGLMRIQLRVRDARISALDKEVSDVGGGFARSNEQIGGAKSDTTAVLNDTIAALTATVAARDSSIATLNASTEVQRKNLATLEAALAAAHARLAKEEAAAVTALELRRSTEASIGEQRQRVAQLEAELAAVIRDRDASVAAAAAVQAEHLGQDARLATASARVLQLEAVVRDRDASVAAAAAVQTEHLGQDARLATASARVLELEAEALDQARAITALQEAARVSVERARALEAGLRAAEDSIHRLEAELRMKSARLDELAMTPENPLGASATYEVPESATPLFIRTDESEVVHVLGRKTTIGRTSENDVQIDAQYISRHHAVILSGPTDTIIEDLNSTNGVIVNGRRVRRQTLKDGDIVLIGKVPFRFAAPRERAAL
jgi:chromosome segregation ATPase